MLGPVLPVAYPPSGPYYPHQPVEYMMVPAALAPAGFALPPPPSRARSRSSSPAPRLSLATVSAPRLSLASLPSAPRLSLASYATLSPMPYLPSSTYPAPAAYDWTAFYRASSPPPPAPTCMACPPSYSAPLASTPAYTPYAWAAQPSAYTPAARSLSDLSIASWGSAPAPTPEPPLSTYALAQAAFHAADAAAADGGPPPRQQRDLSHGTARSQRQKSDGYSMRSRTVSYADRSPSHTPIPLRPQPHSRVVPHARRGPVPIPIDNPHLLYGGIPPTYRNPPPPPEPIVDVFPEPEPEPESEHYEFYNQPVVPRQPSHVPPPPPPPQPAPPPPAPREPKPPVYQTPPGRTEPYMYAHHAPLSPPGWRPGDRVGRYRAHRTSFTAMPEQPMLLIPSPRSDPQTSARADPGGHYQQFQEARQAHHEQHWSGAQQFAQTHTVLRRSSESGLSGPRAGAGKFTMKSGGGGGAEGAPGNVTPRTHMAMLAFEKFDADHSGQLDVREFHKAIKSLGLGYSFADAENLFNMMDEDGNGEMSMQEFLSHCREYIGNRAEATEEEAHATEPEAQAREAFRRFDRKRTGIFDLDTFFRAMQHLGLASSIEDAEQMFELADEEGAGRLNEEAFIRYCVSALGGANDAGDAFQAPTAPMQFSGNPTVDAANLFSRYDEDKNGYLDIYEFMRAMKEIGLTLSFEEAKTLFSQMDTDGSGTMEVEEFTTHYINTLVKMRKT